MKEKRKFVRIDWPVVVEYKTLEEPCTKDQVFGKNISMGGVSFIAYERLPKGAKLDMQLVLPFDSMPISAKAKVVWVEKIGEEAVKSFKVGVEFVKIDGRDEQRLDMYIGKEIKDRNIETD